MTNYMSERELMDRLIRAKREVSAIVRHWPLGVDGFSEVQESHRLLETALRLLEEELAALDPTHD